MRAAPPAIFRKAEASARGLPLISPPARSAPYRSEEHTSELQSPMRISYAVFCFKKKKIRHGSQARYYCRISDPHQRKWRTNKDEREYVVLKCELAEARED